METDWSGTELAILKTVLYASLFEYPLTLEELRRTLLESSDSAADLLRTYEESRRLHALVEYRGGLFFPRGRGAWIDQRWRREIRSLAFLRRHLGLLRVIAALPYVRLLALSGSVAALNADRRADLDLFIITKGPRAWMITLAVVLLSKLLGRRKVVCLNFVMSDQQLALEQQDMFAANQVIQLRPIAGGAAYEAFLAANPFVRRFYPNFEPLAIGRPVDVRLGRGADRLKAAAETVLDVPSRALEAMSRLLYSSHLRRRARAWRSPDQVRLQPACLKLHTHSHRSSILDRFEALCREALQAFDAEGRPDVAAHQAEALPIDPSSPRVQEVLVAP